MSATVINSEGSFLMLKYYIKTTDLLERLRTDKAGVVSFEYVIVAACIVAAVAAAFGTTSGGSIKTTLSNAITAVGSAVTKATAA
jgi:Flp pilus assembly pilin Flp